MGDLQVPRVRFEVLGQLRAWRGDIALELGPLQQRVVLAVLLLHANRPVGRQQFIDAVWGEAAPASAVNLLQRHVSALRRALEPDRNDRVRPSTLIWTDAGYILEVGAGDLDLEVFEEKVRRAQVARGAGDLPAAAEELRAALQLRRGPAFDGLTSPFLDAERDVLTERWMNVAEERLEVDLALSNHRRVITDLRNFVTEYPLRERLRELLMLALYRSDRQADALAVFQDARRRLHDELGVEPAASLQRLHQQILAADPSLADDAERRAGAPAPPRASARAITTDRGSGRGTSAIDGGAPAQLPSGIADFTGRDKEIDQLDSLLPDDHRTLGSATVVTVIAGTAGVGKSPLAVHWAHRVRDRFPDGQLYVNLRGFGPTGSAMQPAEAIRGFLDAFGVPQERIPVSLDSQAALYRSLLDRRRMLVVLDNARDAEQVRPLLPGSRGCLVVITSRDQMSGLVAIQG